MLFISSGKFFLFSRYLNFCLDFLVMKKKRLDWKDKINFKTYDVTTWSTNNYNTQSTNISRSKGNQTMKFGQVIEYNKRNIFLQKSFRK